MSDYLDHRHRRYLLEENQRNINAPGQRAALLAIAEWAERYPELSGEVDLMKRVASNYWTPTFSRQYRCRTGIWCTSPTSGIHPSKKSAKLCQQHAQARVA